MSDSIGLAFRTGFGLAPRVSDSYPQAEYSTPYTYSAEYFA